jgi:PAS domain S-box-containing protein
LKPLLDERFDELAASSHAGSVSRVAVILGVGLITLALLPLTLSVGWTTVALSVECWSWFATRRQARGERISQGQRSNHLCNLIAAIANWFFIGLMYWRTGTPEGALCGVAIWLSIIAFAQTFAYQSPVGVLVGGVAPALGMMATVWLAPSPALHNAIPVWATLLLAVSFLGTGARQTLAARRQHDAIQAQLASSEAGYKMLADNVIDVIALTAADGRRLYTSPSVERVLGWTPEALARMPGYAFMHPDDALPVKEAVSGLVEGGPEVTVEYRVLRKDGTYIWAESSLALVKGGGGNVISTSRDIDARKQLERELLTALAEANTAAAVKSDFLANMTHELRTPLNAIVGFSGVLKGSRDLVDRDARHVGLIHDASAALLSVVNDVLDFSKLDSGAYELDPHPFNPAAMAQSVAALIEHQITAKGLGLSVVVEGDASPLIGDAARLRQVLLNFLSNAVKFTSQGVVEVRIGQTPDGDRRRLRIEVKDSGIGIPDDQLDHVFERFTQADVSVSRQFGGTGLGLAISKRIIETMDGRIGAQSQQGKGSTFWFEVTLPVADVLAEDVAPEDAHGDFEQRLRLLLVEDNPVNRELVTTLLAAFDVDIDIAVNGAEAVDAVSSSTYDLVLMDVQMPVMDGLTATRRIRALGSDWAARVPIIAMTANVLPEQIARCLESGMNDHLGKPINPTKLLETLSRWSQPSDVDEDAARSA